MDTRRTFIGQLIAAVAAFFARLNPNRVLAEASPVGPLTPVSLLRPMEAHVKHFMASHKDWTGAQYRTFIAVLSAVVGPEPAAHEKSEGLLP